MDRLDVGDLSGQGSYGHELTQPDVRRTIKHDVSRCRRTRLSVLVLDVVVAGRVIFLALAAKDARDAPEETTGLFLEFHIVTSAFPP